MNKCKLLLLWQRQSARFFHLRSRNYSMLMNNGSRLNHGWYCSATINSNANGGRNSGINRHHHRLLLLRPTFKANSPQQQFCTSITKSSIQSSDQTIVNSKLPDSIDQQCGQWTQIVRAEWEIKNSKQNWRDRKLRCTSVLLGLNTSKLFLSNEGLSPEQWRTLRQVYRVGRNVELRITMSLNSTCSLENNLFGTVSNQFPDGISIRIHRRFDIQETQLIQQCSFDIRDTENPILLNNKLNFLAKRHSDWCKLPGYATMLQAFKCQPLQEDTGLDPVDSYGKDLDPSQCAALSAALNMKRPIVAVHGSPGSGKTHLLVEYLHILRQQGKKVLVVSSSSAGLYHLLRTFCNKFPSAASSNGTFHSLKRFDAQLASKVIGDEFVENLIEANSISELQRNNIDEKTQKFYDKTRTLKSAMEKRPDLSGKDLMREAEEVSEQMREISHRMRDKGEKNLLDNTSIWFTNISQTMLNMFARTTLTFDVIIIDDANKFSELESWCMTLPTAPVLRLFGDYNQSQAPVHSSMGREMNYRRSLLQRLDEQFGPEVNFHLRRQYRSNAAIQAWPNRAFYGQRAAEPDESVRNIRLDDLLEEGKTAPQGLITDPLILVDLGQLEGEWRDWMFKPEKGGQSWKNWGEALLTFSHLWHLFEHIPQLHPSKIAYSTQYDAQRIRIWRIFSDLFARHSQKLGEIRMERSANFQGQQFDVVIKDSVTVPTPDDPYHLKRLNFEMCRARRQFIWFANSKWLEQGSEQSRQLLRTFHEYGRIVGPNQLMPLEQDQFQKMTKKVEDNFRKVQEQRMRMG